MPSIFPISFRVCAIPLATLLAALVLAGCGSSPPRVSYEPEEFDSTTTHARSYAATEAQTCEAARRALLSQGYLITAANSDLVTGRKNFQPAAEVHVEVEFRVVCARDRQAPAAKGQKVARSSIAFVTALQDRYGLKKTNNSASVGVGVLGSVSLPFSSSDDAMVKVASETLTDERFYDRFFALLDRYLVPGAPDEPAEEPVPPAPVPVRTAPAPVLPVAPSPLPSVPAPEAPAPSVAPATQG
ncbi:DUF2242 domain-containing protein [Variovorax ginsengisoli]|uniref:ABC-type amino acid transport substrate-binding protein n=1 Tax=Variovorax ginsengisoli TaxID=363844 RepID=A0ABT9SA80_9BURK|nr:DUF2242 domain-containing protein [Variovorax ginsengisoli]MDP9901259.1 ABC-type amino acid transport substrate-binding protein [Variovorax ginsengisoli]